MVSVPGDGSHEVDAGESCHEALETMSLASLRAIWPVPQEAGESGDGGVHGDANISHRQAEHQEIAGGPQLSHFEESDDCHRI